MSLTSAKALKFIERLLTAKSLLVIYGLLLMWGYDVTRRYNGTSLQTY